MNERRVHLGGRGLACALGTDLDTALATLAAGGVAPQPLQVTTEQAWPYYAIPDDDADWHRRARRLVRQVVDACGPGIDREAPLYLASSSLNVGALENGSPYLPDCQCFVEEVADWIDWHGPVIWVSTACTSAVNALLSAQRRIRSGAIDSALILGLELKNRFSAAGFGAMQLLDARSARPLAADRSGLVLGEAVAAIQLSAAPGRWRLCGGANVVDGSDPAGASRPAVVAMIERALNDAGLTPQDIDLIKLQAAGSPHNDAVEIDGLRERFAPLPTLLTLKQHLGHTLGAAGAAELALLTGAIERACWSAPGHASVPTNADPAIAATLATAPPARLRHLLANILGFGGGHAALIVEDEEASR